MDFEALRVSCKNKTLLGIGPVSRTVTKVAVELSNQFNIPILLIPSRRQVESKELGGGYVFNTEEFVQFVKSKDAKNKIILARDHGGPRQGANEPEKYEDSFEEALASYEEDIKMGFDILHLDPSLAGFSFEDTLKEVQKLHTECEKLAEKHQKFISYEIGTDPHGEDLTNAKQFNELINLAKTLKNTRFIVGNAGACVRETFNTGEINLNHLFNMADICSKNSLFFKSHNMDYVNYKTLRLVPMLGCHSANVAPEFGTEETRIFLAALLNAGMYEEHQEFVQHCVRSLKWRKWMCGHSEKDYNQLAIICGHYLMEQDWVKEIKQKLEQHFSYTQTVEQHLESVIKKYLIAFGWNV